ncbi:hypothetical protein BJX66DRAFT_320116 [Aspergillus keveii]|uniref:Uncharacterized protein n=1 Tax=Aspergillus keveii TaxID=714993 RepID=A0ABR4FHJ2_9EURO
MPQSAHSVGSCEEMGDAGESDEGVMQGHHELKAKLSIRAHRSQSCPTVIAHLQPLYKTSQLCYTLKRCSCGWESSHFF